MNTISTPQRQSPWAVIFLGFKIVRSIGIVQFGVLIAFLATGGLGGRLLVIVPIAGLLLIVTALLTWWRFTFELTDDEFVVRSGVLRIDRLSVPIQRIQSISVEQELLHRLVGVVKISLDTAGSDGAEFQIDAVSANVADELRDAIARMSVPHANEPHSTDLHGDMSTAPDPAVAPPPTTLLSHSPARLVLAAVTSWPWASLAIFAPLLAVLGQADVDLPTPDVDPGQARWWWIPVGIVVFVAGSVALNLVRVVVTNWGLTVEADGDSIRRSSGLLSRRLDARDAAKVQVVSTSRNPVQRRAGLSALTLSTIGDGSLDVIGCDDDEVASLSRRVGITPITDLDPTRRIHRAEIYLAVRNTAVAAAAISTAAAFVIGWWALLAVVLVPISWFRHRLHVRNFRWAISADELFTRGRIIDDWSEQSLLRTTNGVAVTRTLFQRRRGLASVDVTTAAGTITVGMLTLEEASALRDRVLASVLLDDRPWM